MNMSIEDFRALLAQERDRHDEQRQKLATAMHDEVSQGLTVLTMELALLQQRLDEVEGAKISELLEVVGGVNQAVRRITGELHPRILDEFGLIAALQSESRRLLSSSGITIKVISDGPEVALPARMAVETFRLFQEIVLGMVSLGAKEISVTVYSRDGALVLSARQSCADIGDTLANQPAGGEFIGARERALWIGGELEVQTKVPDGVMVTFVLPIPGKAKV